MNNDLELKLFLAKCLPEKTQILSSKDTRVRHVFWKDTYKPIRNTEWLHVCWMVEETLTMGQLLEQLTLMNVDVMDASHWYHHKSWQQRAEALKKVIGEK